MKYDPTMSGVYEVKTSQDRYYFYHHYVVNFNSGKSTVCARVNGSTLTDYSDNASFENNPDWDFQQASLEHSIILNESMKRGKLVNIVSPNSLLIF